jgi:hypothetical protein
MLKTNKEKIMNFESLKEKFQFGTKVKIGPTAEKSEKYNDKIGLVIKLGSKEQKDEEGGGTYFLVKVAWEDGKVYTYGVGGSLELEGVILA